MRNKKEYRSEIALYKERKMMCQTQQLFVFNNRFTKVVDRVAIYGLFTCKFGFCLLQKSDSLSSASAGGGRTQRQRGWKRHVHQGHKGESEHLFYSRPTTSITLFYSVIETPALVSSVVVFGLGWEHTRSGSHQKDGGPGDVWSAAGGNRALRWSRLR